MKRTLPCILLVVSASESAFAWDTKTSKTAGLSEPEWQSVYLGDSGLANEHTAIADRTLRMLGAEPLTSSSFETAFDEMTVVDLNANYFRANVSEFAVGAEGADRVFVPGDVLATRMYERRLPAPSQFAGLPDYSFTLYDWINQNLYCPAVPDSVGRLAVGPDVQQLCHEFQGWMGGLNSSHFGTQSKLNYERLHLVALELADRASALRDRLASSDNGSDLDAHRDFIIEAELEALIFEGYAQHFFQDRWSSGHMWERWSAAEWASLIGRTDSPILATVRHLYVAAIAGTIHGHEGVSGTQDLLCSPSIIDGEAAPMSWHDSRDRSLYDGVGDYRFADMLSGTFNSSEGPLDLEVTRQRDRMTECLIGGWSEVIARLHDNLDGTRGELRLPVTELNRIVTPDCLTPWATNRDMFRAYTEGLGITATGSGLTSILKLDGVFGALGPVSSVFAELAIPGRVERAELYWRLWRAQRINPTGTEVAEGQGLGELAGVSHGGSLENAKVPDHAEPVDFNQLPLGPENETFENLPNGRRPGRDKASLYGFFNRAHTDWWCESPRYLDTLGALRSKSFDPISVEVCTYLAERGYQGTDPRYDGAASERNKKPNSSGFLVEVTPVCPLFDKNLMERDRDSDDRNPFFLHPGYVERSGMRAEERERGPNDALYVPANGLDSLANWCRRVPVLDYVTEPGGQLRSDDVVGVIEDATVGGTVTLRGANLGVLPGMISVGGAAAPPPWFEVIVGSWGSESVQVRIAPDAPAGLHAITITKASEIGHPGVSSVGRFLLEIVAGGPVTCDRSDGRREDPCSGSGSTLYINSPDSFGELTQSGCVNSVTFQGAAITSLAGAQFPARIQTISFEQTGLTSVALPGVRYAHLSFTRNAALTSISVPDLVTGSMHISENSQLITVSAPRFECSSSWTVFDANQRLTTIELPTLREARGLTVRESSTARLELPSLEVVGGVPAGIRELSLMHLTSLASFSAPRLQRVEGPLSIVNTGLVAINLPALVAVEELLSVSSNSALTSLALPAFTTFTDAPNRPGGGAIVIAGNAVLPTAQAEAVFISACQGSTLPASFPSSQLSIQENQCGRPNNTTPACFATCCSTEGGCGQIPRCGCSHFD